MWRKNHSWKWVQSSNTLLHCCVVVVVPLPIQNLGQLSVCLWEQAGAHMRIYHWMEFSCRQFYCKILPAIAEKIMALKTASILEIPHMNDKNCNKVWITRKSMQKDLWKQLPTELDIHKKWTTEDLTISSRPPLQVVFGLWTYNPIKNNPIKSLV